MKGYFSRLAQQTGIPIRSRTDSTRQLAPHPDLIGDKVAPIQVEETRQVESHDVQPPELSQEVPQLDDGIAAPNAPTPLEETESVEAVTRPPLEAERQSRLVETQGEVGDVEEVPQGLTQSQLVEPAGKAGEIEEVPEGLQTVQRSTEAPAAAHSEGQLLGAHNPDAAISQLPKEKKIENIAFDNEQVPSPEREVREAIPSQRPVAVEARVERLGDAEGDAGESNAFEPNQVGTDKEISREQIWQDTMRAVRQWVAETPVEVEQIQPGDRSESEAEEQERLEVFSQREFSAGSKSMELKQFREELTAPKKDIQDLNLTIGTIHLTVEAPPNEIPSPQPPPTPRERQPERKGQSRRLSRYYLR
jgi:hypothetical protein